MSFYIEGLETHLYGRINSQTHSKLLDVFLAGVTCSGFLTLCSLGYRLSAFLSRPFIRPLLQSRTRIYDTFGNPSKKSWAIISGGSDGIGLEMGKYLAL